jgi:hypothetical protein
MSGRFTDLLAFATPRGAGRTGGESWVAAGADVFASQDASRALLIIKPMHSFKSANIAFCCCQIGPLY